LRWKCICELPTWHSILYFHIRPIYTRCRCILRAIANILLSPPSVLAFLKLLLSNDIKLFIYGFWIVVVSVFRRTLRRAWLSDCVLLYMTYDFYPIQKCWHSSVKLLVTSTAYTIYNRNTNITRIEMFRKSHLVQQLQ